MGQGSFGVVYEATHIETQTKWAIKEVGRPAVSVFSIPLGFLSFIVVKSHITNRVYYYYKANGHKYAKNLPRFDFLSIQAGSARARMLGHEINILKQVNHDCIIHLKEVYDTTKVSIFVH